MIVTTVILGFVLLVLGVVVTGMGFEECENHWMIAGILMALLGLGMIIWSIKTMDDNFRKECHSQGGHVEQQGYTYWYDKYGAHPVPNDVCVYPR